MQMMQKLMVAAAGCLMLASCDGDWGNMSRFREDFHYSYPMNPGARLSVEGMNGSVEVTGWDQNTIDIAGTKYASTQDRLRDLHIDIAHSPDSVGIRTVGAAPFQGNMGASYVIHVPRHIVIDDVHSSNGGVTVESVEGNVRLRTTNGGVNISRTRGDVDAETTNGGIDVDDQTGSSHLHTTNGHIKADAHGGRFEADTSNGAIEATLHDPLANWPVKLQSNNGHIDLSVEAAKLPDLRVQTSNSSIDLRLPASASARLHARTSSSSISCDFDLTTHGGVLTKDVLEGNIGSGGPSVDLNTSNGAITIHKR